MQIDHSGKAALVTGAGRRLGLAIARALHQAGASVAINDRTSDAVAAAIGKLGGGNRLTAVPADLAQPGGPEAAVEQTVRRFGRLDMLVNNAAVNIERSIEETDDAHWDLHLDVVLRASFFTVKAALPWLKTSKGSAINIAAEPMPKDNRTMTNSRGFCPGSSDSAHPITRPKAGTNDPRVERPNY